MSTKTIASNATERQGQKANGRPVAGQPFQHLSDIPDISRCTIKPKQPIVEGLIFDQTVTAWTGHKGGGKSHLGLMMAIAIATGGSFMGRQCEPRIVLYCDLENPGFVVLDRLKKFGGPVRNLIVWGMWGELEELDQFPYLIGHPFYLNIARESKPVIIFDHLRNFHDAEENSSTEMKLVIQHLRRYAAAGACVICMHHPPRQGRGSRGSGEQDAGFDVQWEQTKKNSDLIVIDCTKNRPGGPEYILTIDVADWDTGKFLLKSYAERAHGKNNWEQKKLAEIDAFLKQNPGSSQNQICNAVAGSNSRLLAVLKKHEGKKYRVQPEGRALRYWLLLPSLPSAEKRIRKNRDNGGDSRHSSILPSFPLYKGEEKKKMQSPGKVSLPSLPSSPPARHASLLNFYDDSEGAK